MNVTMIGTGYVGLVTGTCFAEAGHNVICMDVDETKIKLLESGRMPIYEDGLEELVKLNVAAGRLSFTSSLDEALVNAETVFLAIGTPQSEDGSADLTMILGAADQIGRVMTHSLTLVQKSTCPVGTAETIEKRVSAQLAARGEHIPFDVASNPEFLREGSAVQDFLHPDRVVIGANRPEVAKRIASLYSTIAPPEQILLMDLASAQLTKYAANAFLATKISFINDIANLCELVGADVENVRLGIGSDRRIGPAFLGAGIGYGGSCFPKDVDALLKTSGDLGHDLRVVRAADEVNGEQRRRQVLKVINFFGGSLVGRRISVLGLAFKPGTDDMREAPAVASISELLGHGAEVTVCDPVAMENAKQVLDNRVRYAADAGSCVVGADAVILMTEWPEFVSLDLQRLGGGMRQRVLFDFRNGYAPEMAAEAGFAYFGIGRAALAAVAGN